MLRSSPSSTPGSVSRSVWICVRNNLWGVTKSNILGTAIHLPEDKLQREYRYSEFSAASHWRCLQLLKFPPMPHMFSITLVLLSLATAAAPADAQPAFV